MMKKVKKIMLTSKLQHLLKIVIIPFLNCLFLSFSIKTWFFLIYFDQKAANGNDVEAILKRDRWLNFLVLGSMFHKIRFFVYVNILVVVFGVIFGGVLMFRIPFSNPNSKEKIKESKKGSKKVQKNSKGTSKSKKIPKFKIPKIK